MKESLYIGYFGHFIFTIRFKNKYGYQVTHFNIEGCRVIDMDAKNIWLVGSDDMEYLVTRRRITFYEKMEEKLNTDL